MNLLLFLVEIIVLNGFALHAAVTEALLPQTVSSINGPFHAQPEHPAAAVADSLPAAPSTFSEGLTKSAAGPVPVSLITPTSLLFFSFFFQ